MSDKRELELDRALSSGTRPSDPELAGLFDAAGGLADPLPDDAPGARRHKAMFVQGVAARRRSFGGIRFLVPALACLLLLAAVAALGRQATPGDDLYSVRTALRAVGLAESPEAEADELKDRAFASIGDAREALGASRPAEARRQLLSALTDLGRARRLLDDESGVGGLLLVIEGAEDRAVDLLVQLESSSETPGEDDDSSGPGSGDDSDDDNSGPGSDDSEDNSGPGSDDSGSDDDNSGSGSDDSGSDDSDDDRSGRSGDDGDSSGSGSDGDDSDGDSSGSGSGDDD